MCSVKKFYILTAKNARTHSQDGVTLTQNGTAIRNVLVAKTCFDGLGGDRISED